MIWTLAVELAARQAPGRGDDPGLGAHIGIIAVIALRFVLMVVGWFAWQRGASANSARSESATRSTCDWLRPGKNGSASERRETSSQTGNCPSRQPKRSR